MRAESVQGRRSVVVDDGADREDIAKADVGRPGRHEGEFLVRLLPAVAADGDNPFEAPISRASVLAVGAEGAGLPAGAYRYLDRKLTIPMRAPVESLNAAVAVALLLYSPALRA